MENNYVEEVKLDVNPDFKQEIIFSDVRIGFWIRFWAYSFDVIIATLITSIIKPIFFYYLNIGEGILIESIVKSLIFFSYFVLLTKFQTQTLGKMLFRIKVVKENGSSLDWGTVIFRELIGRFISIKVFFIGYLFAAFDSKKRALHDMFADTFIVHEQYKKIVTSN